MSTASTPGDGLSLPPSVTRRYLPHSDGEMTLVGWALFAMLLVLVVPLLPFVAFVWLAVKLGESLGA